MTSKVEQCINGVIEREGGYVNDPRDKGGETCWGVTLAVARANGYTGDMAKMPKSVAADIYRRQYWTAPAFDKVCEVNACIADELFDTGVNMGTSVAAKFFQRCLNVFNLSCLEQPKYPDVVVDGNIGPKTIAAFKSYMALRGEKGAETMLKALNCLQGARYIELAENRTANEAFVYGWFAHRIGMTSDAN